MPKPLLTHAADCRFVDLSFASLYSTLLGVPHVHPICPLLSPDPTACSVSGLPPKAYIFSADAVMFGETSGAHALASSTIHMNPLI